MTLRSTPRLSIIVPAFGQSRTLPEILRALAAQTLPASDFEVIIVADGTTTPIEKLLTAASPPYRVRCLSLPGGHETALRNLGTAEARGKVLVSLGDDMVPAPDFLEQHLKWHGSETRNVVLGGVADDPDSPELFVARTIGWTRDYGERTSVPGYVPTYHDLHNGNLSIRREHLLAAGGWQFGSGSGAGYDSDLGYRLRKHGLSFRADPAARTCQFHSTPLGPALLQARAMGQAQVRYFEKQPDRVDDLIVSPFVLGPLWMRAALHVARFTPGWLLVAYARAFAPLLLTRHWPVNRLTAVLVRRLWALYVCRGFWDAPQPFYELRRAILARNPTFEWFRSYWRDRTSPEYLEDTEDFRTTYGREVAVLLGDRTGRPLEIGCGTGALFDCLGIPGSLYRGVDLSEAMLAQFAARHPELDLVVGEGSSYLCTDRQYDVIFSTAVVQYFDEGMLRRHLQNASKMLLPDGRLVLATVPDKQQRLRFLGGMFNGARIWNPLVFARMVLQARLGTRNGLGHWYSREQLRRMAADAGFTSEFSQSAAFPYFLHAVLRPVDPTSPMAPNCSRT